MNEWMNERMNELNVCIWMNWNEWNRMTGIRWKCAVYFFI